MSFISAKVRAGWCLENLPALHHPLYGLARHGLPGQPGLAAIGYRTSSINWGLLQALGAAGLLALPFIRLHAAWRWASGWESWQSTSLTGSLLAGGCDDCASQWTVGSTELGAMLIWQLRWQTSITTSGSAGVSTAGIGWLLIAGVALSLLVPLSKHRASASYVILSLG